MDQKTGEPVKGTAGPHFVDENGFVFHLALYEVDHEDISGLYFRTTGEIIQKQWLSGEWAVDFKTEPTLQDTVLKTAREDIGISCSKISMSITGNIPDMEYIIITLSDGTEAEIISSEPSRIIFKTPVDPNEIISIIYNGTELLA